MGGMTKLVMATTIAVSLILAFFITLLLILLIDFFKSQNNPSQTNNNPESPPSKPPQNQTLNPQKEAPNPPSLPSYGVLQAPTSFLLTVPTLDRFVCVSNPVYDRTEAQEDQNDNNGGMLSTPYETPESSPSHFGEEYYEEYSPPLKYMKKLPSISTNRNSSCSVSSSNVCYSPSW